MYVARENKALLASSLWPNNCALVCSAYLYSWRILFLKGFHCLIFFFKRNAVSCVLVPGECKMNMALFLLCKCADDNDKEMKRKVTDHI